MKTFYLTTLVILLVSLHTAFSQVNEEWVSRYHNGNSTNPHDYTTLDGQYYGDWTKTMALDNSGNVYVTGTTKSLSDITTIKYNSSGSVEWTAIYDGGGTDAATGIGVDDSGNVYITGWTFRAGTEDYITIKYNSIGQEKWVRFYTGTSYSDRAYSIAVNKSNGDVVVTGSSIGSIGQFGDWADYVTVKYNTNGTFQWSHRYGQAGGISNKTDHAHSVEMDDFGFIYVTGYAAAPPPSHFEVLTIRYSPQGIMKWKKSGGGGSGLEIKTKGKFIYVCGATDAPGGSSSNSYITLKYDTSGTQLWSRLYNSPTNEGDRAFALAPDNSGNVYVTGESAGDFATIKYNSIGDSVWVKRYTDGYRALSIALDKSENVYITGTNLDDFLTVKYNSLGTIQWSKTYDGPGLSTDLASDIAVDTLGNIYVIGQSIGIGTGFDYCTIKYSENIGINFTVITEGFYDIINNSLNMKDTVKAYLRSNTIPYSIIDSAQALIDSTSFTGNFSFNNAPSGTYYIVLKHRNSIETWSKSGGEILTRGTTFNFDFTTAASQAYGNNMILKGTRWCIFSGDVDQDGIVDASDLSEVENDAFNSVTGYVRTDVTGDDFVDGSDLSIVDNNVFKGIIVRNPFVGDFLVKN